MDDWKSIVRHWYPDLQSRTYCVPPCVMNRVPYIRECVAGQLVLLVKPLHTSPQAEANAADSSRQSRPAYSPQTIRKCTDPSPQSVSVDQQPENKQTHNSGPKTFPGETDPQARQTLKSHKPGHPSTTKNDGNDEQIAKPGLSTRETRPLRTAILGPVPHQQPACTTPSLPETDTGKSKMWTRETLQEVKQPVLTTRGPPGKQTIPNIRETTDRDMPKSFPPQQPASATRTQQPNEHTAQSKKTNQQMQCTTYACLPQQPAKNPPDACPSQHHSHDPPDEQRQKPGRDGEQRTKRQAQPRQSAGGARPRQQDGPRQKTQDAKDIKVPTTVTHSELSDDFAQQHVLQCLQQLGDEQNQRMFILSELGFGNYLRKPAYAAAAAAFPKPSGLPPDHRQGDFDILLIHRKYGILIGEIKAIGLAVGSQDANSDFPYSSLGVAQPVRDPNLAKRVKQAVKQLDKSEKVIRHLTSDIHTDLAVRKTLILPYVASQQLKRVLDADPQLSEAVCRCLGVSDAALAVELCLCADQLSDRGTPWHVPPAVLSQLRRWFHGRMACAVDPHMSDDVYLDLVARFAGPATTVSVHCPFPPRVEVRTLGDAVSEIGERLARFVLTPDQLHILATGPDIVCLIGPPGTGKTLTLVLKGLQWLRDGFDVHIPSPRPTSRASSRLIYRQLKKTLREDPTMPPSAGKVHLYTYDIWQKPTDQQELIETLVSTAVNGAVHVIMDELMLNDEDFSVLHHQMIRELSARIPRLCLWAAWYSGRKVPPQMQMFRLTAPLRCAPVIAREVQEGLDFDCERYSNSGIPAPSDGPSIIRLKHYGRGHAEEWPVDCFQCGKNVARTLQRDLHIGVPVSDITDISPSRPPSLQYRDVFVLTRSSTLSDFIFLLRPASAFVRGLRAEGVPVSVLGIARKFSVPSWENGVSRAVKAKADEVVATDYRSVAGLERKVVVCLPGLDTVSGLDLKTDLGVHDRQSGYSRCTTQLVVVDMPPTGRATADFDDD